MRKPIISILAAALSFAGVTALQAQTVQSGMSVRRHTLSQHGSGSSSNGPNAAVKNQQRKFTDPLNANGK